MTRRDRRWAWGTVLLTCALLLSIRLDLVPALRGPAPYPPEWQWLYRPRALLRALAAVPFGLGGVGLLAWSGTAAARRRPRRSSAIVIAGALVVGFLFPLAMLESEDGGAAAHLVRRSASPGYLSYHAVACSPVARDPRAFLRDYPRLLPTLPVHAATHPPGAVLFFRGILGALHEWPVLARAMDPWLIRACGDDGTSCGQTAATLTAVERAAALLGAIVAHAVAVATLLPIAWIAFALTRDRLAAARVAALWPFVPGAALFLPALDPALAFPITLSAAALRHAVAGDRSWSRVSAATVAGGSAGVALFLSYGAAVFLVMGSATVLASLPPALLLARRRALLGAVGMTGVACAAVVAAPMLVGHDPVQSALTALSIHGEEYTARRSYPLWLVYGPLDLAVFLGVPLSLALAFVLARATRDGLRTSPPARFAVAAAATFALLFASGVVRGEVGRLLVPTMPLLLLAAALSLEDEPGPDARSATLAAAGLVVMDIALRLHWRI